MNTEKNLESREYDVNNIAEDKRFLRCKKEMQIILVVGLIQIVIPAILIYTLNGNGKWFLGFPCGMAWQCCSTCVCRQRQF